MSSYAGLKQLLQSWNLVELFQHFKDEGVNIEELRLMKTHHIEQLLGNYKMGVRIRFEHNFELWRRKMNIPLQHDIRYINCKSAQASNSTVTESQQSKPNPQSRATNTETADMVNAATSTITLNTKIPKYMTSPQPVIQIVKKSPKSIDHQQQQQIPFPITINEKNVIPISVTTQRVALRSLERKDAAAAGDMTATPTITSTPTTITTEDASPGNDSATSQSTKCSKSKISLGGNLSLMHILEKSGSKGRTILKYYEEHQSLTAAHRVLLIHLIVGFFEINDYHLSLNMSHYLENQILAAFPTEKLKYYRTEKRGKIYVKFCNMKRYRRDRPAAKRRCGNSISMETLESNYENNDDVAAANYVDDDQEEMITADDFTMDFDNFLDYQPEVKIETENLSDDGY